MTEKLLWVKTGWARYYDGDRVDGNFPWVARGEKGHEAFNFEPASDGTYFGYVPPQGEGYQPSNADPAGWTVVFLAKRPGQKGIHIVGWYEDATLEGEYKYRPESPVTGKAPQDGKAGEWLYSIRSKKAWLVPPGQRDRPFSHISVRQGKYSFLAGPDVRQTANKKAVRKLIENQLKTLRSKAIAGPSAETVPDPENDPIDPLRTFGTPEHRRKVEKSAEKAVVADYFERGFGDKDVTKKNRGYDYVFTKNGKVRLVEIKGTSGKEERFFMTRKEFGFRMHPDWRLAMVTDALSAKPRVTIYNLRRFERRFGLETLAYIGKVRRETA
jgi:hypothetical protein